MLQVCATFRNAIGRCRLVLIGARVDRSAAKSDEIIDCFSCNCSVKRILSWFGQAQPSTLSQRAGRGIEETSEQSGASCLREPKGSSTIARGTFGSGRLILLDNPDVFGLKAFGSFYDVELDRLTFLE